MHLRADQGIGALGDSGFISYRRRADLREADTAAHNGSRWLTR